MRFLITKHKANGSSHQLLGLEAENGANALRQFAGMRKFDKRWKVVDSPLDGGRLLLRSDTGTAHFSTYAGGAIEENRLAGLETIDNVTSTPIERPLSKRGMIIAILFDNLDKEGQDYLLAIAGIKRVE